MSDYLAIATVTATLRNLLQSAVNGAVSGAKVVTVRPDSTGTSGVPDVGVNLYLYQVTPNAAFRNADLPTRRSEGQLVQRPFAALDLHYLLTFHGNDSDLVPQRLLGAVVRTLHAQPMLTREEIRTTVTTATDAASVHYLKTSNLEEAVERIKITPLSLSLEELSKLWMTFFQTHYVLSAAYQASVVLIESQATPQEALPVQGRNLYVVPFRQPVIERVEPADENRALEFGRRLRIRGRQLRGDVTKVLIGDSSTHFEAFPSVVTDTSVEITLAEPPFPPNSLRAGVQGVQIVQPQLMGTPPVEHRGFESNVAAFVLHPKVAVLPGATNTQVAVRVEPGVGAQQRAVLLLNEQTATNPASYMFTDAQWDATTNTLQFAIKDVHTGTYFVRVQIDGAESLLDLDPHSSTPGPLVGIP
jgi:hypothetical protein